MKKDGKQISKWINIMVDSGIGILAYIGAKGFVKSINKINIRMDLRRIFRVITWRKSQIKKWFQF